MEEMAKPIPSDVYSKATITTTYHSQEPNIGTLKSKITSIVSTAASTAPKTMKLIVLPNKV